MLKAKKSLGQNFLQDNNILDKIATSTAAKSEDLIIEIGPGMGALTKKLIKTNSDILCFEIDERMHEYLDVLESDSLKVVYTDFLKVNLENYVNKKYNNIYVIANIPYYITSLIIKKLMKCNLNISEIVLLVQKEYADRVCAHPGSKEYDSLTVYLNYYYDVSRLFIVKNTAFIPKPKVDSAVIKLVTKNHDKWDKEDEFFEFISTAFQQKRKTLLNNLKNYDKNKILNYLKNNNYLETVRAEELSLTEFKELFNHIV